MLSSEKKRIALKPFFTPVLNDTRAVIEDARTKNDIVHLEDYNTSDNIRRVESTDTPKGTTRKYPYQYSGAPLAHLCLLKTGRATLNNLFFDYFTNLAELERAHYGEGYKYALEAYGGFSFK